MRAEAAGAATLAERGRSDRGREPGGVARRTLLAQAGALAALAGTGFLAAREARAAEEALGFGAATLEDAFRALGGVPAVGSQVVLELPDVAENGAVVPLSVSSSLPDVSEIAVVVEANPYPVALRFRMPPGTEPWIATRIKMAASGNVYAVVRSGDRLYAACRSAAVTVGGCG